MMSAGAFRLALNKIIFRPGPPGDVKKCKEAEAKAGDTGQGRNRRSAGRPQGWPSRSDAGLQLGAGIKRAHQLAKTNCKKGGGPLCPQSTRLL